LANAATLSFPTDIELKSISGELDRAIKQEKLVFDMRRESFNTQITALDQLRSYLEQEAVSLEKQLEVHKLEADSVKSEYDIVAKLYQKGLTPVPRKLALERNMAQVDGDRLRLESSLMRARQEIGKTKISIAELQAKRSSEISTEMQTTQTRLDEIKNRSETATSLLYDTENVAPQSFAEKGFNSTPPVFDILRHEAPNVKQRNVSQNETIQPGDTVFVEQPRPEYGPPKSEMSALPSKGSPAIAPTATISASSDRLN
jgi:polysaccharide export outer membrane protein/exopolysaccharide production protein ExoF